MPGRFDPSPRQFGAQAGRQDEVILDALLEGQGNALADGEDSYQYAERLAEARCISYLWSLNQRLANQNDPTRMVETLPRWEKILGIKPIAGDTQVSRRAKLQAKLKAYGQRPTGQTISDLLTVVLGPVFVGLVVTPSTLAIGGVPGGATIPGGVTLPDRKWFSDIAHVNVQTTQPAGMTSAVYRSTVGQIPAYLDDLMPCWVTFNYFKDGVHGPGFFLDEPNLNLERFRI